jgi:NitT/TauT family transport system substrate-binding protein
MSVKRFTCIAAALLALCAGPAVAQGKDKVVLLLNWYVYSEHAPFFLGKTRGYFEKEGIDLDIQEGRGSGVTVQAVAAGTADFGYADVATMIKAASKGAPVIAVGVALQTSPMSVMGFADKNIRKPADIKGKTVAVTPGDSMSQIWPLFLKKTGLKDSDFKTVSGDAQTKLNAVMTGQADLLLGYVMAAGCDPQEGVSDPLRRLRRQHGVERDHRAEGLPEIEARSRQALPARGDALAGGRREASRRSRRRDARGEAEVGRQGHGGDRHEEHCRAVQGAR